MENRIDGILFDVKESLDDFGSEIKLVLSEIEKLSERVRYLEEQKFKV